MEQIELAINAGVRFSVSLNLADIRKGDSKEKGTKKNNKA